MATTSIPLNNSSISGIKRPREEDSIVALQPLDFELPTSVLSEIFSHLKADHLKTIGPLNRFLARKMPHLIKIAEIKSFTCVLAQYFHMDPSNERLKSVDQALAQRNVTTDLPRALSKCRQAVNRVVNLFSITQLLEVPLETSSDRYWLVLTLIPRNLTLEENNSLHRLAASISDASYKKLALLAWTGRAYFKKEALFDKTSLDEKVFAQYRKKYSAIYQISDEIVAWTGFIISKVDEVLPLLDEIPDPYMRHDFMSFLLGTSFSITYYNILGLSIRASRVSSVREHLYALCRAISQLARFQAPIQHPEAPLPKGHLTPLQLDKIILQIRDLPLPHHQIELMSAMRFYVIRNSISLSEGQQKNLTDLMDEILKEIGDPSFDSNYRIFLLECLKGNYAAFSTDTQKNRFKNLARLFNVYVYR